MIGTTASPIFLSLTLRAATLLQLDINTRRCWLTHPLPLHLVQLIQSSIEFAAEVSLVADESFELPRLRDAASHDLELSPLSLH